MEPMNSPDLQAQLLAAQEQMETYLRKIANLEIALESSRRIGIAIGIVMCSANTSEAAAFEILSMRSQQSGRKIRNLAEDVILDASMNKPAKMADREPPSGRRSSAPNLR
jgi:AmiR/NasT family two-component response regulator